MTDSAARILKTRIFARLEQALNSASLMELAAYRDLLRGGMLYGDILRAQWQAKNAMSVGREDQSHLLNHVFDRNGKGWWGPDAEAIAGEGMAQALTRMLFDPDGAPRKAPKRIDCWWMLPGTHHFYNTLVESEQQITFLWVTPPKGDQPTEYALYEKQLAIAEQTIKAARDPNFVVPDDFTRRENSWTISASRWTVTHGVDAKGKPRPCAEVIPTLTPCGKRVTVTRALCEEFQDRYPQGELKRAKSAARKVRLKRR